MPEPTTPERLIDPDCRDGKCGSCVGGLCEHYCHDATPAQVANFDQIHAEYAKFLDDLIKTYRDIRAANESVREVDIAGLSAWLQAEDHDRVTFAELLAVAVVRLAEEGPIVAEPVPERTPQDDTTEGEER